MVEEILFWKFDIRKLNNKSLCRHEIPHLFIYSDASSIGLVNFAKFLRTPFLTEHLRWLLVKIFFRFNKKFIEKQTRKVAHR